MLCAALFVALPAAAQDQAPSADISTPKPDFIGADASPQDFDLARKKVVDCKGEKFQFSWGAGSRPTRVTLCSKKDATPNELVTMLEEAAAKLEQTATIAEDRRTALVHQIRAKIAEIKSAAAHIPAPSGQADVPPPNPPAAVISLPPLQPLPMERSTAIGIVAPKPVAAAAPPPAAGGPQLTIECTSPADTARGDPCVILAPDTWLIVTAGEEVTGGTKLRFVRRNKIRAETALKPMRKGQSVRLVLPRQLCAGVLTSEASIEVVRGGAVLDSLGPFLLRC